MILKVTVQKQSSRQSLSKVSLKKYCLVFGIYRPSLLNQKHSVGWFLLQKFVDLVRVCSILVIIRKHSSTFLLINLRKTKICLTKTLQQGLLVLILGFWEFAKSRVMRIRVVHMPTCQKRAKFSLLRANIPTCQ